MSKQSQDQTSAGKSAGESIGSTARPRSDKSKDSWTALDAYLFLTTTPWPESAMPLALQRSPPMRHRYGGLKNYLRKRVRYEELAGHLLGFRESANPYERDHVTFVLRVGRESIVIQVQCQSRPGALGRHRRECIVKRISYYPTPPHISVRYRRIQRRWNGEILVETLPCDCNRCSVRSSKLESERRFMQQGKQP